MKQGFSFGMCIRDIVNGLVPYDDVRQITARTNMPDEASVRAVIKEYMWRPGYLFGLGFQECLDVGLRLFREGKVDQPRQRGEWFFSPSEVIWVDVDEEGNLIDVPTTTPFNQLTPAESERLSLLSEECSEIIQAAMKIQRHGYDSGNPFKPGSNNRADLEKEIGHLMNAIDMMINGNDIRSQEIAYAEADKKAKIKPYLHHQ